MRARFVHFSDAHLGKIQYGRLERAADFARAYAGALHYALDVKADFVLIAGDLFEQKAVDPETFDLAATGLRRLRDSGIPVFAIEGNHEKFLSHGVKTWVWYLAQQDLLHLLDILHEQGEVRLRPWDSSLRAGTYFDLAGIRIMGVGYYGARLPQILEQFVVRAAGLPSAGIEFSICLLHTGVDDKVDYHFSGASAAELYVLRPVVDYVALGHVHHQFALPEGIDQVPWLFNPGALENWNSREVGQPKGIYDVTIDTDLPAKFQAVHVGDSIARRDYIKLTLDAGPFGSPDELRRAVRRLADAEAVRDPDKPIVELRVGGVLRFERSLFDAAELERILAETLDCLVARVMLEVKRPGLDERSGSELKRTRAEIETDVLTEIFGRYTDFAPHATELAKIASRLRTRSLEDESPENLVSYLIAELERSRVLSNAGE